MHSDDFQKNIIWWTMMALYNDRPLQTTNFALSHWWPFYTGLTVSLGMALILFLYQNVSNVSKMSHKGWGWILIFTYQCNMHVPPQNYYFLTGSKFMVYLSSEEEKGGKLTPSIFKSSIFTCNYSRNVSTIRVWEFT